MKQGVLWAWFVYFAQIPFVIWYAQEKIPIHPIVVILPLIGLLNFKVENLGIVGIGLRLLYPGRSLFLAIIYAGLSLCGLLIAARLGDLSTKALQQVQFYEVARLLLPSFIVSVFIIALWEEFINRGYIQSRLQASWGIWGVVITSLLFASMHAPSVLIDQNGDYAEVLIRFVETGLAGFALGYVYWLTDSVLITIAVHGLNNFCITGIFPLISNVTAQQLLFRQTEFRFLWLLLQVTVMIFLSHLFYGSLKSRSTGA